MFPIRYGLKQDALSPLLLNFSLGYAIRRVQINQGGLKLNGTHQLLVYADVNKLGGSVYIRTRIYDFGGGGGYVKDRVFVPPLPRDLADLKARIIAAVKNIDAPILTPVWQELEYRIDVCRVTRGARIEYL